MNSPAVQHDTAAESVLSGMPGHAFPLGATVDESGTNFSLFSSVADGVELCLIAENGDEIRVPVTEMDDDVWHIHLAGIGGGQRYGYRIHGPFDPAAGRRCDPTKFLIDPYAKAIDAGGLTGPAAIGSDHSMTGVVTPSRRFDWAGDAALDQAYCDVVIYEAHVKGMTQTHPLVPEQLRGTYAGMAHPAVIEHLTRLGVNAIELMPVHHHVDDGWLLSAGLRNYWGYNTIGFFAPHTGYACSPRPEAVIDEFKSMVRALHQAGIEVILDVVYNHTAEGNHQGPTISFRGIDNAAYYHLVDADLAYYMNYSGAGNSLNAGQPAALQLIMDSLRYWVTDMHVDGFRFDLAAALARQLHDVDRLAAFFDLVQQDPVISRVKLIAEPWDVGDGGYQVGNFPALWSEWNGRYRDTMRDYWRGQLGALGQFATRLAGSSDTFGPSRRRPTASINFITCHDGFTLADLVSYNGKHNEQNPNNDGEDNNRSWGCGAEGPTGDPSVVELRARQHRNFLATVMLSQGTPMLLHGDEFGRTQLGNNNAYCQDSPLSWMDWSMTETNSDLLAFTRRVIGLRNSHPIFHRRRFFAEHPDGGDVEIAWLTPSGVPLTVADWDNGFSKSLMVYLNGAAIPEPDPLGRPITDDAFVLCFNAHWDPVEFRPPAQFSRLGWTVLLDTADARGEPAVPRLGTQPLSVLGRSLMVLVAATDRRPD
jgi:isoamylase